MARALADILTELNSAYQPQRDLYNNQLGMVDPQLEAEQKGLEAQKQDSFQQITNDANRRGMFYSGLPIQEEQKYTGGQFLPAVANLKAKYAQQRFSLQDALAKITQDQASQGQGIYQQELDRDENIRQFNAQLEAQRAAARAAAGAAGGFRPGSTSSGSVKGASTKGIDWGGTVKMNNPWVFADIIRDANKAYFGGKGNYGQLDAWLQQQLGGKVPTGSAADLALRSIYLGTDIGGKVGNNVVGAIAPAAPGNALYDPQVPRRR